MQGGVPDSNVWRDRRAAAFGGRRTTAQAPDAQLLAPAPAARGAASDPAKNSLTPHARGRDRSARVPEEMRADGQAVVPEVFSAETVSTAMSAAYRLLKQREEAEGLSAGGT